MCHFPVLSTWNRKREKTKNYRRLLGRSRTCLVHNRPASRKEIGLTRLSQWIPRLCLQFEIGGQSQLRPRFGLRLIRAPWLIYSATEKVTPNRLISEGPAMKLCHHISAGHGI